MTKQHPLKGRKQRPETIAKRKATYAARRAARLAYEQKHGPRDPHAKDVEHAAAAPVIRTNGKDAAVYLNNALAKWPREKKRGIARLYVELALATLEEERLMDPKQTLIDANLALHNNEIDQCGHLLDDYWAWRTKQGFEPELGRRKVKGDKVATALRALLDSGLYPL